ncbi:MAG: biotin/lipoyl-binding protein [Planctomycetia bacterium]|nr:biotin/lipoyl-binding protein [Planctomycetia bacterium]
MSRSRVPLTVQLVIFTLLILSVCSCKPEEKTPTQEELEAARAVQIPLVQLTQVQVEDSLRPQTFSAVAKEGKTVQLSFRVPGQIQNLTAKVGEVVQEGDELAQLDQRDFLNTLAVVEAGLAELQAGLDAKMANRDRSVEMLKKQVDAAKAQFDTVDKNLKKFTSLEKDGAVPEIKLDELKLQHEQALAAKVAAERQFENGVKGLDEEIKGYEAKKAGLLAQKKQAQDALADTVLKAPCRGFVTQKYAETGEVTAPAVPILAFTDVSEILVQTTIPETLVVRQEEFASFQCSFETYPNHTFPAELNSLGKALQTGGYGYPLEVKITELDNFTLYPGMAASLTINFRPKEGECVVPLTAIVGDYIPPAPDANPNDYDGKSRETVVWIVSPENTIQKKKVKILRITQTGVVVMGEIVPGEWIVGPGARFLREEQKVRTR